MIEELEAYALSNKDLARLLDKKNHLVLYPDLIKYNNIDDVLGKYGMCTLLFESKPNYGHWVCLWKLNENTVSFFNSYHGLPDDSLDYISDNFAKISNQNYPYLSRLLFNCPYNLTYNQFVYQKKGKNIKTCGRHVVVRLWARDLGDEEYHDYVNHYIDKYNLKDADEFVTLLTS